MIPTPFISDRRTEGQKDRELKQYTRGKYGLEGQKQVSPRQRLGNSSRPTFAQNGQKNYYSTHSLCHSLMVGCHSFAPFGGVSLRHTIPRALPGAGISMPHSGRKPYPDTHPRPLPKGGETDTHPQPLPKGGEIEAYTNSDRRTKEHNTPSLREGWGWAPTPLFLGGCVAGYCGLKILIFDSGG